MIDRKIKFNFLLRIIKIYCNKAIIPDSNNGAR
jgi:hypothetical protein